MPQRIARAIIEHGRATEWLTSCVMLGFAATLAMPGDMFDRNSFYAFRALGLEEGLLQFILLTIAIARLTALYINGRWHRSPLFRCIGAIVGAFVFAFLSLSFAIPWLNLLWVGEIVSPSTAVSTYGWLAIFEVLAAYRSAADLSAIKK